MLYKMMEPSTTQVGDRVIVFAGIIRGEEGTITHIAPKGYGIITRYRVQLDNGQETACSITEIYLPTPEADPAAERDQLREVNAELLAALESLEKMTSDLPLPSVHNVIRAAIEKARKEG